MTNARRPPAPGRILLPPVHRAAHAAGEQDRRVSRVASGVHAQVHAVNVDYSLAVHNVAGRYRTFTAGIDRFRRPVGRTGLPPGFSAPDAVADGRHDVQVDLVDQSQLEKLAAEWARTPRGSCRRPPPARSAPPRPGRMRKVTSSRASRLEGAHSRPRLRLGVAHRSPPAICLQIAIGRPTLGHLVVDCNQFEGEVRGGGASAVGLPHQCRGRGVRRQLEPARAVGREFDNRRYFRELLAGSEEGIASNILADRLKRLVRAACSPVRTPGRDGGRPTADRGVDSAGARLGPAGRVGPAPSPDHEAAAAASRTSYRRRPWLWREFMAELRTIHLGEPAPERDGPTVVERLAEAYAAAL